MKHENTILHKECSFFITLKCLPSPLQLNKALTANQDKWKERCVELEVKMETEKLRNKKVCSKSEVWYMDCPMTCVGGRSFLLCASGPVSVA